MPRYIILNPSWKEDECLQKSEVNYFAREFEKNPPNFDSIRTMHPDIIYFLLKCITDLIHQNKRFKCTPRQKMDLIKIFKPYKKKFLSIANPKNRTKNVKLIQKGKGVLISSLIAVVAPMVFSLVKRAMAAIHKVVKK